MPRSTAHIYIPSGAGSVPATGRAGEAGLGFVRASFLAAAEPMPAAPLALIEGEAVRLRGRVKVKSLPVSSSEHKSYGPIGHSPLHHSIDWGAAALRGGRPARCILHSFRLSAIPCAETLNTTADAHHPPTGHRCNFKM